MSEALDVGNRTESGKDHSCSAIEHRERLVVILAVSEERDRSDRSICSSRSNIAIGQLAHEHHAADRKIGIFRDVECRAISTATTENIRLIEYNIIASTK